MKRKLIKTYKIIGENKKKIIEKTTLQILKFGQTFMVFKACCFRFFIFYWIIYLFILYPRTIYSS